MKWYLHPQMPKLAIEWAQTIIQYTVSSSRDILSSDVLKPLGETDSRRPEFGSETPEYRIRQEKNTHGQSVLFEAGVAQPVTASTAVMYR